MIILFSTSIFGTLLMIGTNEPYTEFLPPPGQARAVQVDIDGRNLGNTRPPVSESELGDAQYYRMPGRTMEASYRMFW